MYTLAAAGCFALLFSFCGSFNLWNNFCHVSQGPQSPSVFISVLCLVYLNEEAEADIFAEMLFYRLLNDKTQCTQHSPGTYVCIRAA